MSKQRIAAAALAVLCALGGSACDLDPRDPTNEEVDAPPDAEAAIAWAAMRWEFYYGRPMNEGLPLIRWFKGNCLDWTLIPESGCLNGMTFSAEGPLDTEIDLIWRPHAWESALAHELLHVWMNRVTGDPDPDHTRKEWGGIYGDPTSTIGDAELRLCQHQATERCAYGAEGFVDPVGPKGGQAQDAAVTPPRPWAADVRRSDAQLVE